MSLNLEPPNPVIYTFVLDRLDEKDATFTHPAIGPIAVERVEWEASSRPGTASLVLAEIRPSSITRGEQP